MKLPISKVLLVGDYSGVHAFLYQGLKNIGIEVTLVGYPNDWRENFLQINFRSNINGILGKVISNLNPFFSLNKLKGFDCVQFINYSVFNKRFGINEYLIKKIVRNSTKSFLCIAGCDSYINNYYKMKGSKICNYCLKEDRKESFCSLTSKSIITEKQNITDVVDGLIPLAYEYSKAYQSTGNKKLMKTLPLPIDCNSIKYRDNKVSSKLIIFHGINRTGFKGTTIIAAAMKRIAERYPNDVEIIIDGKMPFNKYIEILSSANIVIDQLFNECLAMNALISMAQGKVLVCGNADEAMKDLGIEEKCPAVFVDPTIGSVENALISLVEAKKDIPVIGYKSRQFVVKYFNHVDVAKKFLKAWSE
jgi:glycosyltransferase involved in cell wall biosynthesis